MGGRVDASLLQESNHAVTNKLVRILQLCGSCYLDSVKASLQSCLAELTELLRRLGAAILAALDDHARVA